MYWIHEEFRFFGVIFAVSILPNGIIFRRNMKELHAKLEEDSWRRAARWRKDEIHQPFVGGACLALLIAVFPTTSSSHLLQPRLLQIPPLHLHTQYPEGICQSGDQLRPASQSLPATFRPDANLAGNKGKGGIRKWRDDGGGLTPPPSH